MVKIRLDHIGIAVNDLEEGQAFQVFGFLNKEPINFIVNHWPSRGGGKPSIEHRFNAGKINRSIIDSIQKINPKSRIISMGDFNDCLLYTSPSPRDRG